MKGKVRLTVQLRDRANQVRLTEHVDVPLGSVKAKAGELAERMGKYYRQEIEATEE